MIPVGITNNPQKDNTIMRNEILDLFNSNDSLTVRRAAELTGSSIDTVRYYLNQLVKDGMLMKSTLGTGRDRATHYEAVQATIDVDSIEVLADTIKEIASKGGSIVDIEIDRTEPDPDVLEQAKREAHAEGRALTAKAIKAKKAKDLTVKKTKFISPGDLADELGVPARKVRATLRSLDIKAGHGVRHELTAKQAKRVRKALAA